MDGRLVCPESLSGEELVLYAQACHRVESTVRARLADAAHHLRPHLEGPLAQMELSAALNVSETYAANVISLGFHLESFPATAQALEAGLISPRHATVLVDLVSPLDPRVAGRAIYLALDTLAGPGAPGDERSVDERRFDAAFELARRALERDDLPQRHRRFVTLGITMTRDAALGQSETPAELAGYGPIPAYAARELFDSAEWRALLIDDATARLQAMASKSHDLTAAAQDFIEARDGTCCWPPCSVPASRSQTEHAIPYPEGASDPTNCGPMSQRHHNAKTRGHWKLRRHPDGRVDWTSPLGFTYSFEPPPHPHERR